MPADAFKRSIISGAIYHFLSPITGRYAKFARLCFKLFRRLSQTNTHKTKTQTLYNFMERSSLKSTIVITM